MAARDENLLPLTPVQRDEAARQPEPLRLHKRVHAELIGRHNEGFVEGVCHALDTLQALGFDEAYEAALGQLFTTAGGGHG